MAGRGGMRIAAALAAVAMLPACATGAKPKPGKIRIGDNVVIDDNCLIDAKGESNGGIRIGSGVFIGRNTILSCKNGDIELGDGANIGAGTVICNYDGEKKNETVIEDGAFIGSDTMLVAPVRIGRKAATGAGSVVTKDVPNGVKVAGVPARAVPVVKQGAAKGKHSKAEKKRG